MKVKEFMEKLKIIIDECGDDFEISIYEHHCMDCDHDANSNIRFDINIDSRDIILY